MGSKYRKRAEIEGKWNKGRKEVGRGASEDGKQDESMKGKDENDRT